MPRTFALCVGTLTMDLSQRPNRTHTWKRPGVSLTTTNGDRRGLRGVGPRALRGLFAHAGAPYAAAARHRAAARRCALRAAADPLAPAARARRPKTRRAIRPEEEEEEEEEEEASLSLTAPLFRERELAAIFAASFLPRNRIWLEFVSLAAGRPPRPRRRPAPSARGVRPLVCEVSFGFVESARVFSRRVLRLGHDRK